MSFRIEEKLLIGTNRIVDFKSFLFNKTIKQIYEPRKIHSLYFDNLNYEMYSDSLEGLTPRKNIRVRNYPDTKDQNLYLEIKISSVEGRFKIMLVPNITNICYGRGVGYKIEEIVLPEEIQKISATKIRAKMREEGKLKKS